MWSCNNCKTVVYNRGIVITRYNRKYVKNSGQSEKCSLQSINCNVQSKKMKFVK